MKNSKRLLAMAISAALAAPMAANATNGMNLDGYGAIAAGMGGASMAYDNGTAAMMNNPATLGMMEDGNRLDLALGVLAPDVKASHPMSPSDWNSAADSFLMPAVGWVKTDGKLSYGAGAFAQGGMGTDYAPMGPGSAFTAMSMADPSVIAGWKEFSEVGVMRILFPVAYRVNDKLNVAGSIDYVRAGMDLQMAMPATVMGGMMVPGGNSVGTITMDANMMATMGTLPGPMYGGYFNFADDNDYTGQADGDGFAAKIGFTYQATPELNIGGTYHSETSLSDLSGSGSMDMAIDFAGDIIASMPGTFTVVDFQWPSTMALGMSYQANDKLMVVADIKQINWSDVMKDFKVRFDADGGAGTMEATMYQNWDDQTVVQLGAAYSLNNATTLRAGLNMASNPIPDNTVNYLFPATVEKHYTVGVGHALGNGGDINFSMTYTPSVTVTGSNMESNMLMAIEHSQMAYQLMYSMKF